LNQQTDAVMQGDEVLANLSPLEDALLKFLLEHPYIRHTKTEIIINAWPDVTQREGVTDDSLYQIAASLRKKVEPLPTKPVYLVTWRGNPEGGYQLYPEGRPG
jgi:DNA-binding response OmpR family regulator